MAIPSGVIYKTVTVSPRAGYSALTVTVSVDNTAVKWKTGATLTSMLPEPIVVDGVTAVALNLPISGQPGLTTSKDFTPVFYYTIKATYKSTDSGLSYAQTKTYYLIAASPDNQDFGSATVLAGGGGTGGGTTTPPPVVVTPSGDYEPAGLSAATKATLSATYAPIGAVGSGGTGTGGNVIAGGDAGQVLAKNSSTNYDVGWKTISASSLNLGSVNNTADLDKPISNAQAVAINAKYTKSVSGIPASDLTAAVQTQLAAAATAVQPAGLTKTALGLSNVDNTSDANKPVSTAQATINANKADLVAGLIPTSQIPSLALTKGTVVTNQAAMLALTTAQVQPGDFAVRTDGTGTWILGATDPSVLSNWINLTSPTDSVSSVAGRTGSITLGKSDVGLANVDNTADSAKPVSTAQATAIAAKYTKPSTGIPLADLDSSTQAKISSAGTGSVSSVASRTGAVVLTSADLTDATTVGKSVLTATTAGAVASAAGLGNVNNTADTSKPVSTAQAAAIAAKSSITIDGVAQPTIDISSAAVTPSTLGLGNVNNTADTDKPVSTAQAAALATKAPLVSPAFTGTPTGITKTHVGLANVDNTADTAKPVSTAQASALALKAPLASPTFTGTVSGITPTMVGLGNVNNTTDAAKPVSTAQAAAIAGLISDSALDSTHTWSANKITSAISAVSSGSSSSTTINDTTPATTTAFSSTKTQTEDLRLTVVAGRGVNVSGLEFDTQYDPTDASIAYAVAQGATKFRVPYKWERVQPTLGGALDSAQTARLDAVVTSITSRGAVALLDNHNYARYNSYVLGDGNLTSAHLADHWSRLAQRYQSNPLVEFGLMNEPHDLPSQQGTLGTEIFTNTGFETNTTGWTAANSSVLARVTTQFHTGAASMSITAGSNTTPQATSAKFTVDPTKQYQISYWSKAATTARQVFSLINFFDSSGAYLSTYTVNSSFITNSTSAWTQVVFGSSDIVIPSTAATASVIIAVNNAASGEVHYIDDVSFKPSTGGKSGAQYWEASAQAAVTAIRATGATQPIMVAGMNYSSAAQFWTLHPTWFITDPLNKSFPEAHYYPDGAGSGTLTYAQTITYAINAGYAASGSLDALLVKTQTELNAFLSGAQSRGVKGFIGEIGWFQSTAPITAAGNTPAANELTLWNAWGEFAYQIFDKYNTSVTYWSAGDAFANFSYAYSVYLGTPNNSKSNVASVVEAHYNRIRPLDLPVSRATSNAITAATSAITKTTIGLGNVDNTADTAKPVSTAQQTALNLKAPLASPTFTGTVSGVTAAMVGLGNVNNTADTAKPVSTAQAAAIAGLISDTATDTTHTWSASQIATAIGAGGGGASSAPKIDLYAADYGVSTSNTAAQNDTAIANAITAAQAAGGAMIRFAAGNFQVSAPINAKATSTYGSGIGFKGAGRSMTFFTNVTTASELLQVGGYNNVFEDFTLQHTTFSSTTGDGIVFYKCAYSSFRRIQIQQTGKMMAIAQTSVNQPGTSSGGGANWMFSCLFDNINGNKYWKNALYLNSYVGGSTGSSWSNCYFQNISDQGTQIQSTGNAIDILNCDFTGTQINVEDLTGTAVLLANGQCAVTIAGLHLERTNLPAGFNSLVRAYGGAQISLQAPSLGFSNLGLTGSGNSSIFSVGGGGQLSYDHLVLNNNLTTVASPTATYSIGEVTDTSTGNALELGYYSLNASPTPTAYSKTTSNSGLKRAGDLFPAVTGTGATSVVTDTYAATVTPNAAAGETHRITLTGNITINGPTNPLDGQSLTFELTASGAARTVTLTTGSTGSFAFGTDFTAIPTIASGTTTLFGATYNATAARWRVLPSVGGF